MLDAGPSLSDYLPDGTPLNQASSSTTAPEHLQVRPSPAVPAPAALPAPQVDTGAAARRSAGLTLLGAAMATGAGAWMGGAFGAGAGLLVFGGVRNALRARSAWVATPPDTSVATRSATLALFGLCAGAYLGYRAYTRKNDG